MSFEGKWEGKWERKWNTWFIGCGGEGVRGLGCGVEGRWGDGEGRWEEGSLVGRVLG